MAGGMCRGSFGGRPPSPGNFSALGRFFKTSTNVNDFLRQPEGMELEPNPDWDWQVRTLEEEIELSILIDYR